MFKASNNFLSSAVVFLYTACPLFLDPDRASVLTQAHSPLKLMQQKKAECTRTKHDLLGLRSGESITLLPTLIGRSNLTGVEVAVAVAGRSVVEVGAARYLVLLLFLECLDLVFFGGDGCILCI